MFVTGAGFTRAFVPDAPLSVDEFDVARLVETVRGLPFASRLLDAERSRHRDGSINLERLMVRLKARMPYDYTGSAATQYAFLLSELTQLFLQRLSRAMADAPVEGAIVTFAQHCARHNASCVTFNCDDFLDIALSRTGTWSPDWGYGFFCRPSHGFIYGTPRAVRRSPLKLLKLHGSVNWWPLLGHHEPTTPDALVYHHFWEDSFDREARHDELALHLAPLPVILPAISSHAELTSQPLLRIVWTLAFDLLSTADSVTFIGYSVPDSCFLARTLFADALIDLPPDRLWIVDRKEPSETGGFRSACRALLGKPVPDEHFFFGGARDWVDSFCAP